MSPADGQSDDVLQQRLSAARAGAPDALGQLLESFRHYLLCVAEREVPADLKAKVPPSSAVQETFVKAVENFDGFRGQTDENLKAWLAQILRNHVANVVRSYRDTQKRDAGRERPLTGPGGEELPGELAAAMPSPSDGAIAAEEQAALHRALAQLSELHRQVIEWRNYERLPFAEIGDRLGRTEEAARQLWRRAIEHLAALMGPADDA
jgi:RNA polymerase sigma-70 factor (ECF subfamily)